MTEVVKATSLYIGVVTATSYTVVYTVPTGKRVILKEVSSQNEDNAAASFGVRLNGTTVVRLVNLAARSVAGANDDWRPWLVLTAGHTIELAVGAGAHVGVAVSGSVLYV